MKKSNLHVVIGLGATGWSCVRFLLKRNIAVVVMDTRPEPPLLATLKQTYPDVDVYCGPNWPQSILNNAKALVVSPGISVATPAIEQARAQGVDVIGDIELFAHYNRAPVIAITGSNGKSTVTTLVGEMARAAGKKVAVVGNIGTPVLESLDNGEPVDLVVMELSSFQLETTYSLAPLAATVLNISPDHMDRYQDLAAYAAAKHRIYHQAQYAIVNKQDPLSSSATIGAQTNVMFFTLDAPKAGEFGVRYSNDVLWLAFGDDNIIASHELKIMGKHNIANALAALALGTAAGLPREGMCQALRNFSGLPHRCQWVGQNKGVTWVNDSKGTNVGACQAALKGIGETLSGKIVLILGGLGKGADFTALAQYVSQYCRAIIVMGQDAPLILAALAKTVTAQQAKDMSQAVALASERAQAGDVVLLSPSCASFDQFNDFSHRGEVFMDNVKMVL